MKFLKDRNLIIIAVVLVLLFGGFYISNNNNDSKDDTKQEDQVNLDENENSDSNTSETEETKPTGVSSTEPAANKEIKLADVPKVIVIKTEKELDAGSEIQVISDKSVDVVSSGNKISADYKTLTVPIEVTEAGKYTITYNINWQDGTKSVGKYTVNVVN